MANKFVHAAEDGDTAVIEKLIGEQSDVNTRDRMGRTPLFAAAGKGHLDIAHKLIRVGARVNSKDRKRWTPLHNAACHGQTGFVKILLEAEADKNRKNRREATPLMLACKWAHLDTAEVLVSAGCSTASRDMHGRRPLHWAIKGGNLHIVRLLLEHNADINAADNWGKTPVIQAVKSNRPSVLDELLSGGALTSGEDRNGRQALHLGCEKNSASAVRRLLEAGVSPELPLETERTPLMDTTFNCHMATARAMLEHGADVNATDKQLSSALHHLLFARVLCSPASSRKLPWYDLALLFIQENANVDYFTDRPIFAVYRVPHHPQNTLELALKDGLTHFIKLFFNCGCELGNVNIYLKMKTKELPPFVSKNIKTLDMIRRMYKNPRSLKIFARKAFRSRMPSVRFTTELSKLQLAPGVQRFVMYEEMRENQEIDLVEEYPEKTPSAESDSELDYEPSVFNSNEHLDRVALDSD